MGAEHRLVHLNCAENIKMSSHLLFSKKSFIQHDNLKVLKLAPINGTIYKFHMEILFVFG